MFVNGFVEEDLEDNKDEAANNSHNELDSGTSDHNEEEEPKQSNSEKKKPKKRKKGIIYVSNIPKHMNVTRIREYLGVYGDIGRVYLQPEKLPASGKNKDKKKKRLARHFTEGWVEFDSKRVAKRVAELLNNKQIGTRKRSKFYDSLWSLKYLPRFKWIHLSERLSYEQAVHKQRLLNEVSQARKEANFFQNNLDKSEHIKKKSKQLKKVKS